MPLPCWRALRMRQIVLLLAIEERGTLRLWRRRR